MSNHPTDVHPSLGRYRRVLSDAFAKAYQTDDDFWSDEEAMQRLVPLLLQHVRPDSLILDVGAGRGRDAEILLAAGHRVEGVDLVRTTDWDRLDDRFGDRVSMIVGDFCEIELDKRYDAVLDNGCLHHQHPDRYVDYLTKVRSLTVPGGPLAVSFFAPTEDRPAGQLWIDGDERLTRDFVEHEIDELLTRTGWTLDVCLRVPRQVGPHCYLLAIAR